MASRKAETYWKGGSYQSQGYVNEPGVAEVPEGRSGEAIVRGVMAENEITANDEIPETCVPDSTGPNHHPGPRCLAASWYPTSRLLRVQFQSGSYNFYNVSEDDWHSFQSAPSAGRWINAHAFGYGLA